MASTPPARKRSERRKIITLPTPKPLPAAEAVSSSRASRLMRIASIRPAELSARTATGTATTMPTPGTRLRSITRAVSGEKVMFESLVTATSCAAASSAPARLSSLGLTAPIPGARSTRAGTGLSAASPRIAASAGDSSSAAATITS